MTDLNIPAFSASVEMTSIGPNAAGKLTLFSKTTHTDYSDDSDIHNQKCMAFVGGLLGGAAKLVEQAVIDTAQLKAVA